MIDSHRQLMVAVISSAFFAVLPVGASAQTERQSLSGHDISIYNLAGHVRVERGSGADVTVEVTRGGRHAAQLKLVSGTIRGRHAFRVLYPDGDDIVYGDNSNRRGNSTSDIRIDSDGTWGHRSGGNSKGKRIRVKTRGSGTEAWADLVIRVPSGKSVQVYLAVGELSANDVDADLRLDVSSARVSATNVRGALDVDAGSGGVEVRGASGPTLTINNGSGGVRVTDIRSDLCRIDTGSGGVGGTAVQCKSLRIDVGSGGIRLDEVRAEDVGIDTGSGSVSLGFLASPSRVMVETGSGGVSLALPATFSATVDIESGSGGISSDFPVQTRQVERRRLRGTIGSGEGTVRVETGSGSVRLTRSGN